MRTRYAIMLLILALTIAGCRGSAVVREVQEMRISGQLQEARKKALSALNADPSNQDLWLEFGRVVTEQAKRAEREDSPQSMQYLIEASLICGGYYKFKDGNPPREWYEAGRLAAAEATKEANKVVTELNTQTTSIEYLQQILTTYRPDSVQTYAQVSAEHMMEDYRSGARDLIYRSVIMKRLLELLPDLTAGSSAQLVSQIDDASQRWEDGLKLSSDLVNSLNQRANRSMDKATGRVMGDLQSVGYFIPDTIIENGIME